MRRLAVVAVLAMGLFGLPSAAGGHIDTDEFRKGCGFSEDDWEEGVYDCGGGIPSIQNPGFESAESADEWLGAKERVIGVAVDGTAKAYPIPILNWHEIANDEVDGTPIAVTYCPLCDSALVFERTVDNRVLDFHVSGYLYRQDLVMVDEQTHSLWPQIEAEAARGPLHGSHLALYPSSTTTWEEWNQRHPDTLVLERPRCGGNATDEARRCSGEHQRNYDRYPYGDYRHDRSIGISGGERLDIEGLHPKARVLGVTPDEDPKAYPFPEIANATVIHDEHAGRDLVVAGDVWEAHAYVRPDGAQLTLDENVSRLVDEEGRAWDFATGEAQGSHADLDRLDQADMFWFAWLDHHPETAVYTANGTVHVEEHTPPKQTPGPGAVAILAALALTAAVVGSLAASRRGGDRP